MENQTKKILLLSNDPADASFLSEIAVMQQAILELATDTKDLCTKIAESRADQSLAAIFVDVSTPDKLRKFEHEFQSRLGNAIATELSRMVHFISGVPLALNREVRQSPYFSFYSERKNFDFHRSAEFYQNSFYSTSELVSQKSFGFDQSTRTQCFEKLKTSLLSKEVSPEWIMKFKKCFDEMIETLFPVRFDFSIEQSRGHFRIIFTLPQMIDSNLFAVENFLTFGVSSMVSAEKLILFIPIFKEASEAVAEFKFYKVES